MAQCHRAAGCDAAGGHRSADVSPLAQSGGENHNGNTGGYRDLLRSLIRIDAMGLVSLFARNVAHQRPGPGRLGFIGVAAVMDRHLQLLYAGDPFIAALRF